MRRYWADMAMFDPRAYPLHAALGFVLVPPDEASQEQRAENLR